MVSTFTTNKSLEKPGNGDYVDTWNVPVNGDLDVIDQALGTVTSVNLAGGNVTLADTQYRSMGLTFTGALPAARTVTIPSGVGGSWIVTNNTTDASGGPWSVTVLSGGGGTSVALVRSKSSMIYSDGTNITEVNINAAVGTGSVTSVAVSGGTTGLTTSGGPITTSGTITISGTLIPANGGTGITSYTIGDIPYASASGTLSPLASVATGNVLLSGGIAGAPSYGKVGLTTHVTGTLPVANGGTGVTSSTGSGSVVLSTSPALTTPDLGTPSAVTLTNATGLPIIAGTTGTLSVARGGTGVTTSTGTGNVVLSTSPTLTTPNLGTPSAVTLTNGTGLPIDAGTTGTLPVARGGTGVTSSTGTGSVVLSTSPTLTTPNLGTPSAATLTNATGLPIIAGTTGTLTVARGGNGLTATPTNGQIDIGNGSGFTRATLTAGTGITVTNGAGSISVANAQPGFSNVAVFTSSGSWTVPAGVTKCKVTVIGGGGGGGGSQSSDKGAGGGAGGAAIKFVSGLTPGASVTVTVGTGGTAAADTSGGNGGTSSFGAFCSATGGTGGSRRVNITTDSGVTAASGTGSSGDINLSGYSPAVGTFINPATPCVGAYYSSFGGTPPLGFGFGGAAVMTATGGVAGTGYGAGGSGSVSIGAANRAGGVGTGGIVIVEY